jgi:uncharacterized protein YgiM (DUF1202 family)
MKIKFLTLYAALISTSLLAQQATNSPSAAPIETPAAAPAVTAVPETKSEPAPAAAATSEPAAKPAKKNAAAHPAKKPAAKHAELKTTPLMPGSAVVAANRVNVRGQAGLKGEVVTRLTNGEPVTVIEEIKLKKSGPEEPSVWAKIALPAKTPLWVKGSYLDPATRAVQSKKLNLRSGPGENFSVLGTLQRGDVVKEVATKGGWVQIQAPANTWAFVAAQYLTQEPAALAAAGLTGPATAAASTPIAEPPAVVEAGTNAPPVAAGGTNELAAAGTNEVAAATPEEPPPPRIVLREGIVRGATSIQSPTGYELISVDSHKLIDYLYTTSPHLDLSRYKGLHIIVTGEEGLDERWKNTPVINIHRIQVLD